jgi:hypothetical protein
MAAILIMNSHMTICYNKFQFLSTGGGIGDTLFFFVSGFALVLGKRYRFDNWFKRRIQRLYPTIIAISLVAVFIFSQKLSTADVLLCRKYWFVNCILCYYIVFYPLLIYANKLRYVFEIVFIAIVAIYFIFFDFSGDGIFYGRNGFRQIFYFLFMIQGAIIGLNRNKYEYKPLHLIYLIAFIALWYCLLVIFNGNNLQIISVLPLLGITRYGYSVCSCPKLVKIYHSKYIGYYIYFVSALCLEIYVIQKFIITDALNSIFPINIPILMIGIITAAYMLRILSNFIRQTFENEPYYWKKMVQI